LVEAYSRNGRPDMALLSQEETECLAQAIGRAPKPEVAREFSPDEKRGMTNTSLSGAPMRRSS
jgi:hypothetical protein